MRTTTRSFLAVGTAAASLAVGIVGARALQGDDDTDVTVDAYGSPVVASGDPSVADDQQYPLVRPVAIGDDPAIVEQLVESPPDVGPDTLGPETGRPGDSPVIGVATGAPVDVATATPIDGEVPDDPTTYDLPYYFDPAFTSLFPLPELAFDTCAGATPGTPPPPPCPEGYGATLLSDHLPPTPFMFGSPGHYLTAGEASPTTCPAATPAARADQQALTIFSVTPLTSLQVQWRRYGTSEEWQSLTVDQPTLPDQRDAWLARLDAEPFDRATWGLIPRCIVIDRDPNRAYEVLLTATDEFGREVTANRTFTLSDATPEGRPPTTARIVGVQPLAQIEAWTTPQGSVTFRYVLATDTNPNPENCDGAATIPGERVHTVDGARPIPVGIYDARYTRQVVTTIDLPPGATALLCATIYDTRNRLRPLGTDILRLQARTAQRPTITLEGFRLNDGVRIDTHDVWAVIQAPGSRELVDDGCGQTWSNPEVLSGGVVVQAPLWECEYAALPVDGDGWVKVPVTIIRQVTGSESPKQTWGIPIQVDRCDPACPVRPAEYYEIPVPSNSMVLCGRSFWESDDGCPQPTDGVAIVKVTYPIIEGAGALGTSRLLSSTDRPVTDPTEGAPIVQAIERTPIAGTDWRNLISTLDVVADRPITISQIVLRDAVGDASPDCSARELPYTGPAATEFVLELPLCAGAAMSVALHYTDAAGARYEQHVGYVFAGAIRSSEVQTTVELLGGEDAPTYGWMYQFHLTLDGQSAGYYDWFRWDGPRGAAGASCMALDGTVATSHGSPAIRVFGTSLEIGLSLNITTGGDRDCSGNPRDGLGVIELTGSFTIDQLMAGGPLVLTTPPDAALQLRITVDPVAPWRLVV